MNIVFSNIAFFVNDLVIKRIPKIGNLQKYVKRGDVCTLFVDTTCHACTEPKESSIPITTVKIHEVYVTKLGKIKEVFEPGLAEDFIIDLNHQMPGISDDDDVTIISLFEY